ncbi:MAG: hypothetical protein IAE89_16670 [Anaerolineae bacterium]|nr:hypothetical protein [Anaerolineae bacterium]
MSKQSPSEQTIIFPPEEEKQQNGIAPPPIHAMSALATIALDAVWSIGDLTGFLIPVISAITGILCFLAVLGIQKSVAKDDWASAFPKALVMAILAGVPFPVLGTATGAMLLGWAGLSSLSRLGSGKN